MSTVMDRRRGGPGAGGTVVDWLRHHAAARPDTTAFARWRDGAVDQTISYGAASAAVDELARGLWAHGVRPADRVLLSLPNEPAFVLSLVACAQLGAVAVPAPIPAAKRTSAFRERLLGIVSDCAPTLLVTEQTWVAHIADAVPWSGRTTTVAELLAAGARADDPAGARADDPAEGGAPGPIALLQYTSGSTGRPRGIAITHDNLAASCAQAAQVYSERPTDTAVTWVPLYHDMGLVTGVMRPLFSGYRSVLLRPEDFARDPTVWLEAVSTCGATLSSAPNFAYDLCVRKLDPARLAGLDLRRWRVARNAGEVVRADTVDRFVRRFATAGFRADALAPSYGLAEATLAVTTCAPGTPPLRLKVDREALERGIVHLSDRASARELLSSGVPVPGTRVRVDAGGDAAVGVVEVTGPQLSPGHWGGELDDRADRWYATGDLGFLHAGHLFVLGRADDTLVHHGRNYYLSDVVAACGEVPQVRPGRLAPFITADAGGGDMVHVVAELRAGSDPDPGALAAAAAQARRRLALALELFVGAVHFVPAGTLPVTTSGKVRASEVRRRFESGDLALLPQRR